MYMYSQLVDSLGSSESKARSLSSSSVASAPENGVDEVCVKGWC